AGSSTRGRRCRPSCVSTSATNPWAWWRETRDDPARQWAPRRVAMSETTRNLELEQRLSAFVDGELDPEEAEEIRRILGEDPAARARLDDLQALSVALQTTLEEIGEEADFEGFADEVMRRVERAKAPAAAPGRRRFFEWGVRRRAPIFAAAAALAAVAT